MLRPAVDLGGEVEVSAPGDGGSLQVFVTPDGRYTLVANQGTREAPSTTVSIVDTATLQVVNTVETGSGAHGVVIDPTGTHAYTSNIYGNDVAVLDLEEQRVVATIPTGAGPNGISFSPFSPTAAPNPLRPAVPHPEAEPAEEHAPTMPPMPGMGH